MEITHTWKVRKLVQKNDENGLVIQVFYKIYSTDGEYSYVSAGTIELGTENISNFIPYQDLTEEIVLQWIRDKLGSNSEDLEKMNVKFDDARFPELSSCLPPVVSIVK
jgi:hypothetical protein